MTIHSVDLKTKKRSTREWTAKETADMIAARKRDKRSPEKILELKLSATEGMSDLAEVLEGVVDFIENGTPLPNKARDWLSRRKEIKGQ